MGWIKEFGTRNVSRYGQRMSTGLHTGSQRWTSRRTSVLPGATMITSNMLNVVEEFLQDSRNSMKKFQYGEAALVMLLAKASQGYAQALSRGPVDPQMRNSAAAHRIPVRRITSRYYQGWKVRRIAPNIWEMYNEDRAAFFVEYGLGTNRVRRPVRKLAQIRTLQMAKNSQIAYRMLDIALGPGHLSYSNATYTAIGSTIGGLFTSGAVRGSP